MNVIAFDAMIDEDAPVYQDSGVKATGLHDLILQSDVVTLHVPAGRRHTRACSTRSASPP